MQTFHSGIPKLLKVFSFTYLGLDSTSSQAGKAAHGKCPLSTMRRSVLYITSSIVAEVECSSALLRAIMIVSHRIWALELEGIFWTLSLEGCWQTLLRCWHGFFDCMWLNYSVTRYTQFSKVTRLLVICSSLRGGVISGSCRKGRTGKELKTFGLELCEFKKRWWNIFIFAHIRSIHDEVSLSESSAGRHQEV